MDDQLKIGIPDDEAAIAPKQKFRLTVASTGLLARWIFPLVVGAIGFAGDKNVAATRSDTDQEDGAESRKHSGEDKAEGAPEARHTATQSVAQPDAGEGPDTPDTGSALPDDDVKVVRLSEYRHWRGINQPDALRMPRAPIARLFNDEFDFDDFIPVGAPDQPAYSGAQRPGAPRRQAEQNETRQETDDDQTPTKRVEVGRNRPPVATGRVRLPRLGSDDAVFLATSMLLAGASDPDGDPLSITSLTSDTGRAALQGNGTWLFAPEEGFIGTATLRFTISDGKSSIVRTAEIEVTDKGYNVFTGTPGDDVIIGSNGDDLVEAGDGDDTVHGGAGNDVIYGHCGDDLLFGGPGDDVIFGGCGDDEIHGNEGDDVLYGEDGHDRLFGDAGHDTMFGGDGDDMLDGGDGDDVVMGEDGNDRLSGCKGNDVLDGGAGDDTIDGGAGDDMIVQSDPCGKDVIDGGQGYDTINLAQIEEDSRIDLGAGTMRIGDGPESTLANIENSVGGSGDDEIGASAQVNVLTGGAGDDRFIFDNLADLENDGSGNDQITDFAVGDRIDLSLINAELSGYGLTQLFFAGAYAGFFQATGAIQYYFSQLEEEEEHTIIRGRYSDHDDDDDDDGHEFELDLRGHHDLDEHDFIFDHQN
ncbi:calcium-binding protein [Maritimibacter sp. DP1N21-5]|uniref:calcium-binding protein n=1 Tax=Maritimibacter sp. DP1N21-5 TaxID=2836867 RepID=UPI001C4766B4|nr:cadherin-like domain-containing protein [Maritimibacter sp. DP1N21-5]MBV7409617.1 cadherin-like domain-containing protein [Maritimibacter sp. DP1N21-5]